MHTIILGINTRENNIEKAECVKQAKPAIRISQADKERVSCSKPLTPEQQESG